MFKQKRNFFVRVLFCKKFNFCLALKCGIGGQGVDGCWRGVKICPNKTLDLIFVVQKQAKIAKKVILT